MKKQLFKKIIGLLTEENMTKDKIMEELQKSKYIITYEHLSRTLKEMHDRNLIQRYDSLLGENSNIYYIKKNN